MNGRPRKVRVLEIMHGLAQGGIETIVLNIFEGIEKTNFDIEFALATDYPQFHEKRVLNNHGKIYRTSDLDGIGKKVKHFIKLIRLLNKYGPFDVVHSHIDFFNGINLFAAWIAGVPVRVSHSHNTNSANSTNIKASFVVKVYRLVMKVLIYIFATHKIGCSAAANDYMYGESWRISGNNRVLFNAIDLDRYNPNGFDKDKSRELLDIPKDKIQFITIGRMCEQKNSLFIENILYELAKIRDDINCSWVGDGRLEKDVKDSAHKHGIDNIIKFLGVRRDIPEILSAMDYFLFPSRWEGLGTVLIEAQAMGVPCFISDKIPDEANLGLCTVISLDDDAKSWAEAINNSINEKSYSNNLDREKMNKYNVKNMIKEIESIYSSQLVRSVE